MERFTNHKTITALTFALVGVGLCRPLPPDIPVIWQASLAVGAVRVVLQQ